MKTVIQKNRPSPERFDYPALQAFLWNSGRGIHKNRPYTKGEKAWFKKMKMFGLIATMCLFVSLTACSSFPFGTEDYRGMMPVSHSQPCVENCPAYMPSHGTMIYPTIPGTTVRDYSLPGYRVE